MSKESNFAISDNFFTPKEYNPPKTHEDMKNSTEYPNFNVHEYRQKPVEQQETKLFPFYECISNNSEGVIVLATNNYPDRICNGSIFGFEDVTEACPTLDTKEPAFKACVESPVTDLKFIEDTTFLMSESNGRMTLFSTRATLRATENSKYCLLSIGEKTKHNCLINCFDIFREKRQKALSGDEDGCLVTWDLAGADLVSIDTIRFAHVDAINSITTSMNNDNCFVTASDDKIVMYWDLRDAKPCLALLESQTFQAKAVEYVNENELVVGDKAGIVYLIDARMPKKIIFEKEVHDESIHKFIVNGQNIIILTDSNQLLVQKVVANEIVSLLDVTEAPDYLRSGFWINDSEFYVAGWSNYLQKHKI